VGAFSAGRSPDAVLFAAAPVPLAAGAAWVCRPADRRTTFRRVVIFQTIASSAFGVYALARLVVR
jgi:hypothetical protein